MSISDIINRTASSSSSSVQIQTLLRQAKTDFNNIRDGYKYLSRSDLVESGFSRVYDETQNKLLSATNYETTSRTVSIGLSHEKQAIDDVKAIVSKFTIDITATNSSSTPTSRANEALKSIQDVLSRQVGGKYVMGGNTPDISPLAPNADLVNNSNYDSTTKNFFNNFSKSSADTTKVNISADHTINNSLINASMDEIVDLIGAINLYKNDQATSPEYSAAIQKANDALNVKSLSINTVITKTIPDADLKNTNDVKNAKDTVAQLFTESLDAITGRISLALQSLIATFSLINTEQNLKNKIFGQGF